MKFKTTALIGIISVFLFSGCSVLVDAEETVNEITSAPMDQSVQFDEELSDYKSLTLHLDFEVSDVTLVASEDQTLHFKQKANRKELLAEMKKDSSSDHMTLTFENKTKLNFNTKNSKITIAVPKNLLISLESDIDVGNLSTTSADLKFNTLAVTQNVGETVIELSELDALSSIESSCDVGSIHIKLDGDASELKRIKAETNVGEVTLKTAGTYSKEIDLTLTSNVGDVDSTLYGTFENINGSIHTDTGSVNSAFDKSLPAKLKISANEFTGDVSFEKISMRQEGDDIYFINNAEDKVESIIKVGVNIGDITISN